LHNVLGGHGQVYPINSLWGKNQQTDDQDMRKKTQYNNEQDFHGILTLYFLVFYMHIIENPEI